MGSEMCIRDRCECVSINTTFIRMHTLALLVLLLSEHDSAHWELSCDEWNESRIEILSDENLNSDAHEYLIDYFRTKVSDEQCETWQIGRK